MHIGRLLHTIIREFYNKLYGVGTQHTNNNNIIEYERVKLYQRPMDKIDVSDRSYIIEVSM